MSFARALGRYRLFSSLRQPIARTKPVENLDHRFSPLVAVKDRGQHPMFTTVEASTDVQYYAKRITYDLKELQEGRRVTAPDFETGKMTTLRTTRRFDGMGIPSPASLSTRLKTEELFSLWNVQKEVFITRFAKQILDAIIGPGHTREEVFAGKRHERIPADVAAEMQRDYTSQFYVVARAFPEFEHFAQFGKTGKEVLSLFNDDDLGHTVFKHPLKGDILTTGRIAIKILEQVLGQRDRNIRNLAFLGRAPDGRYRIGAYDFEMCEMTLLDYIDSGMKTSPEALGQQLAKMSIVSNLRALNLPHLKIASRDHLKRHHILAMHDVYHAEGQVKKTEDLISSSFSPGFFVVDKRLQKPPVDFYIRDRIAVTRQTLDASKKYYDGQSYSMFNRGVTNCFDNLESCSPHPQPRSFIK